VDLGARLRLRALRELPRSKVTVYADRVEVEAISDSAEQQAELLAGVADAASRPGSRSSSTSPRRARSSRRSSSVRFSMRRGFGSTIAPPTRRARRSASSPPRAMAVHGEIDCPIGLGVPSPSWASAVETGLAALVELGSGTLSFSDATVTLIAAQGTEQDEFDR
jgi:OOP family OmpA-OmpF porin